ncbi:aspartyl/asparaginyl beta-hydroxylase domain-containing protein [Streptosporangium sp. NBC_01639]|uniref:aspartyl/asparaginyl beta-hydroxylase domain-containing protein n=1 Tax=Streptosporangium sp. NBC_01639 TaxID=2975948 RepID=UPI00386F851C|nr:aspartyl/asparaginyl beta-hydroxylase domain-containing protein [Streptosporangium sp. NBC_01639]
MTLTGAETRTAMIEIVPDLLFDPEKITEAYQQVVDRVPVADPANPDHRLRRLGLTHRAGADDPWHDAGNGQFNQATGEKNFEEAEFRFFNEELTDTYFHEIYRSLPFQIGRMRLVALHPSEIYHMHTDASRVAHMAIKTNEDCRLLLRRGETYHVPTDGRIHILNTLLHHSAYNAGGDTRIHLTMTIVE